MLSDPVKYRDPDDFEKADIRSVLFESIASGVPEADLKLLRKKLADKYQCSVRQVASIGAYIRYSATEVLSEMSELNEIAPDQLIEAAFLIQQESSEDRKEYLALYADDFDLHPDTLDNAIKLFEDKLSGRPGGLLEQSSKSSNVADSSPLSTHMSQNSDTNDLSHLSTPPAPHRVEITEIEPALEKLTAPKNVSEWEVDYDNSLKELWRDKWKEFIKKHLSDDQLHGAKVVCMPSIQAHLEVRKYIELGVQPQNIHAVEYASGVHAEKFRSNCEALGINPHVEDVVSFLDTMKDITILNLDFHGGFSYKFLSALRAAHLAPSAVVITNCLGRREKDIYQALLHGEVDKTGEDYQIQNQEIPALEGDRLKLIRDYSECLAYDKQSIAPVSETRSVGIGMGVWRNTGLYHREPHWKEAIQYLKEYEVYEDPFYRHLVVNELCEMAKALEYAWKNSLPLTQFNALYHYAVDGLISDYRCYNLERYKYISRSGSGGSPYESAFLHLGHTQNTTATSANLRRFVWAALKHLHLTHYTHGYLPECTFQIVDRRGCLLPGNQPVTKRDTLRFKVGDRTITQIEVRKLVAGINKYTEQLGKLVNTPYMTYKDFGNVMVHEL